MYARVDQQEPGEGGWDTSSSVAGALHLLGIKQNWLPALGPSATAVNRLAQPASHIDFAAETAATASPPSNTACDKHCQTRRGQRTGIYLFSAPALASPHPLGLFPCPHVFDSYQTTLQGQFCLGYGRLTENLTRTPPAVLSDITLSRLRR